MKIFVEEGIMMKKSALIELGLLLWIFLITPTMVQSSKSSKCTTNVTERCFVSRLPRADKGYSEILRGACYPMASSFEGYLEQECCCADHLHGDERRGYCAFLAHDDLDGWMYPWRGRHPNPPANWTKEKKFDYRCFYHQFCIGMGMYRFGLMVGDSPPESHTNKLLFTDSTIAQEGISFCLVGRHFSRSPMVQWGPLRGFLPITKSGFDIGNHIDPDDPNRMNSFQLPDPRHLHKGRDKVDVAYQWNKNFPTHEYEYVYLGHKTSPYPYTGCDSKPGENSTWRDDLYLELVTGFMKRPAHPEYQPNERCKNPYKLQVTTIESDGMPLHNYLHIKVYAEPINNPTDPTLHCPTGKIKLLMLEVRDQNGYPVGQFTDDIPCDQDEATLRAKLDCPLGIAKCKRYTGTKGNQVPCLTSHPKSTIHPSIFMLSAADVNRQAQDIYEFSAPAQAGSGGETENKDDYCRYSWLPKEKRKPPTVTKKPNDNDYFTEVHATWKYAQMNPGWVSELHFATLIIEDETPIQYYTSRKTEWCGAEGDSSCEDQDSSLYEGVGFSTDPDDESGNLTSCKNNYFNDKKKHDGCCKHFFLRHSANRCGTMQFGLINRCVNKSDNTNRPYGYSARYSAIKPTFKTAGGWDFFHKGRIDPVDVNCHVDITYGSNNLYELKERSDSIPSKLPVRRSLIDFLKYTYKLENVGKYKNKKYVQFKQPNYKDKEKRPLGFNKDRSGGMNAFFYWSAISMCYEGTKSHSGDKIRELNTWELPDWHTLGYSRNTDPDVDNYEKQMLQWWYYGTTPLIAAKKMFRSAHQDPVVLVSEFPDEPVKEYFGSEHLLYAGTENDERGTAGAVKYLQGEHGMEQKFSMAEMGLDPNNRCPCPFIPTTPPPELQTKGEEEIDARQVHVVNMLIAWMILVPLSFFVARFFKETYSKVFFLQEFWWYTIHVLSLLTALLFTVGGLHGMFVKRKKDYQLVWTDATKFHYYGGYVVIGLFVVHLVFGAFRFYNLELRLIQIALHWGIGWLEYMLAVAVILSSAAMPSGLLNCASLSLYCCFLVFQLCMTLAMEYHLHYVVDAELKLVPPRSYLPTPMMRVFHRDAPFSNFRIIMLIVFFAGCIIFYFAMHFSIRWSGGEIGCFQPVAEEQAHSIV